MKKFYYWANDIEKNSGEGILARNFLKLIKIRYKNYRYININNFSKKNNLFYDYITPYWGIILIWKYHLLRNKVSYINYLPIWNFFLFLLLPKKTILGPITGTDSKKNILYLILKNIGIFVLKSQKKNFLFSHSQFKKKFLKKKNYIFNFLLFNFKFLTINSVKKYDIIFYYRNNNNKGNNFLLKIIQEIAKSYKVAVIGDKIININPNLKIINFGKISRNNALKIIEISKFAIMTKENNLSFFALDCLSKKLEIFSNDKIKLDKSIKTNMFTYIDFDDFQKSLKIITRKFVKKENKINKYFNYNSKNFLKYLAKY